MAHDRSDRVGRRGYLQRLGVASIAGAGLAGCLGVVDPGEDPEAAIDEGLDATNEVGEEPGGEIVAGTAPGFPPFEMREGGEIIGFDVDLLEAVVAETDYELAGWEAFEFDSLIPALASDRIDVIAAAMTITEERAETIAFTDPYYSADQSVLVAEGREFQPESLEALDGLLVGAQRGTTGELVVQEEVIAAGTIDEGDYRGYDNYVLAVQDLENGNVDAIVVDRPVAETFAAERAVEVAFVYETGEEYGFGLRQGEEDLLEALNEGIAAVEESSQYETLTAEWFGQEGAGDAGDGAAGDETPTDETPTDDGGGG